ncbi:iron-containing redox enzyme family protein [Paenibacillus sp. TRM 82003]|uniref:iron-containing redox enzyme family protein n=1 Tax=Kineococcus sp. TRM81007 TaxID=2925831 RepID=UPI001F57D98C|nr:iron-containing redox enzyme family protein [Kineococcus sp. TRM81007]MCI2239826.1 iron-containing redox enzyme family protein [Kineococcus sp. TRM81007]MCI3925871.1 iron-containing redox enzyme family protein [Paenibacillus sp. TRM 82003]
MTATTPTDGLAVTTTGTPTGTPAARSAVDPSGAPGRLPLPPARGELSAALLRHLRAEPAAPTAADLRDLAARAAGGDVLRDEDAQLALFLMYELHYRGLEGVDDALEWDLGLLGVREVLEGPFEAAVRALVEVPEVPVEDVAETLFAMAAADDGPGVSAFLQRHATLEQVREFLVHRSIYHLKEADPHTWAVPRLAGGPKAALVEVQADEYGGGRPERMHSALFARTMRAAGLDDAYGRYLPSVPATTLVGTNAMSLFGLHRRLRGAIVGHLAVFEMTSSLPNKAYGNGLRRLGFDADATWFFDEHVQADAVHEQIAGRDLAGALARREPELAADVLFGAAACLALDALAGEQQLASWERGRTSLLVPWA